MDDGYASSRPASRPVTLPFGLLFAGALLFSISNFLAHSSDYILDLHGYRQTQTAITVYWFLREGFRLDYLTPALGAPWSAPFEFPLFQLLTAWVVKAGGSSIDTAGRTVSFVFCLATLWPFWLLGRTLRLPRAFFFASGALYLCSPLYLFWGKAFLIESMAVFLTVLFLTLALDVLLKAGRKRNPLALAAITLTGVLAALVKITTAAPALLLVAWLLAFQTLQWWRHLRSGRGAPKGFHWHWELLPSLAAVFVSLQIWTSFSDSAKKTGEITSLLVSSKLRDYIFGFLYDRFDGELWRATVLDRSVPEALGAGAAILLGIAIVAIPRGRERTILGVSVLLFLAAFVIFAPLHILHTYYQCANAVYLILAGGLVISALAESRPRAAISAALIVVGLELVTFRAGYGRRQGSIQGGSSRILPLAHFLKDAVDSEGAILAFGFDGSHELAYYSERKTVTVPQNWYKDPAKAAREPERFLGGTRLGAVVVCPEAKWTVGLGAAVQDLTRGARHDRIGGCEVFTDLKEAAR